MYNRGQISQPLEILSERLDKSHTGIFEHGYQKHIIIIILQADTLCNGTEEEDSTQ